MVKKVLILFGSPRENSNTKALLQPFEQRLRALGCETEIIRAYDMKVRPCTACLNCQADLDRPACVYDDDMGEIYQKFLQSDLIVLATPVYSWNCPAPLKAILDRCVNAFCKYCGEAMGPSLAAGKKLALVTTCGYPTENGADLWEECCRRYCKHLRMSFLGQLAERQKSYSEPFLDSEKEARAASFADEVFGKL